MYFLKKLDWDTKFFNYPSYRLQLNSELNSNELEDLVDILNKKGFYTIQCKSGIQKNISWISENTKAVLVDVNMQFINKLSINYSDSFDDDIKIENNFPYNDAIISFISSGFNYSRFINDVNINNDKALNVYVEWMKNAFDKEDKYFSIYSIENKTLGVILFSIDKFQNSIVLELVCVNKKFQSMGIGTKIIKSIFSYAKRHTIKNIKVGTQLNNISAINFYINNGFLVNDVYYTFHLWI